MELLALLRAVIAYGNPLARGKAPVRGLAAYRGSVNVRALWSLGVLACTLLLSAVAQAADWDRLWRQLADWEGAPSVELSTDLSEPYASAAYRALVNGLVERGFTVHPAGTAEAETPALRVELRQTGGGMVVAVSRTRDGALLLVETLNGDPATAENPGATRSTSPAPDRTTAPLPAREARRLPIDGHPVRLAALPGRPGGALELVLLYDERLAWVTLDGNMLRPRAEYPVDRAGTNALYVGAGELDGDAAAEVAVVWGENRRIPTRGWNTRLDGRLLELDGGRIQPESPALQSYLRLLGDTALTQQRGRYTVFDGPVRALERDDGGRFVVDDAAPHWQGRWLYRVTPLPDGSRAVWSEPGRLSVHAGPDSAGTVLGEVDGLGETGYPTVSVELRNPTMDLGPQTGQRKEQRLVALPPRVAVGRDGAIYTIQRDRSQPLRGLVGPTGADRVVRLQLTDRGLSREAAHEPVEAFILDFALIEGEQGQGLVLLLNEEADGSGEASVATFNLPGS